MIGNNQKVEVILLDDGSNDDTLKLASNFIEGKEAFRIYKLSHRGVSAVRNEGIKLARGKYITFIDSDDEYKENNAGDIIQKCLSNADVIILDTEIISEDRNYKDLMPQSKIELIYLCSRGRRHNGINSKFYKRSFILENDILFDEEIVIVEDTLFIYTALTKARSVLLSNYKFYNVLELHSSKRYNPQLLVGEEKYRLKIEKLFGTLYNFDDDGKLLWVDNKLKLLNFFTLIKNYYTPLYSDGEISLNELPKKMNYIIRRYNYDESFQKNDYDSLIGKRDKIWRKLLSMRCYRTVILLGLVVDKFKKD